MAAETSPQDVPETAERDVSTADSSTDWRRAVQTWRLLDALVPYLLHQPVVTIPQGVMLVHTGLTVVCLTDGSAQPFPERTQSNALVLENRSDQLAAWIGRSNLNQQPRWAGVLPWIDPDTFELWLSGRRLSPPFLRLGLDGVREYSALPVEDALTLQIGFDFIRLRCDAVREVF